MGETAARSPKRTAKRVAVAGAALVVVGLVLVAAGMVLRQQAIDDAIADTATFQAPGEKWISGGMGERGIWVEGSGSTSAFEVTIEDASGPVPYRRLGLFGSSSTLEVDGTSHRLDGEFTPTSNTYSVTLTARDDVGEVEPVQVAIGPPDGYELPPLTVATVIAGALALLVGGGLLLVGLILALVGRGSRPETLPPPPPPSPPTAF